MTSRGSRVGVAFAIHEGWRNAATDRLLGLMLTILCTLVAGSLAVADSWDVARIEAGEAAWITAGGHVLVVSNDETISAASCEALNQATGVRAAVGVDRLLLRSSLTTAPDANIAVVGATPGLTGFLDIPPTFDRVIVSNTISEDYGLVTDQWVGFSFHPITDTSSYDPTGAATTPPIQLSQLPVSPQRIAVADMSILGEEYSSGWTFIMAATGGVNTCMVWAEPGAVESLRQALPGVLPGPGETPTVVADRLSTSDFTHDYYHEYTNRAWRWTPILGGVFLGLMWILIRWVRRSEDGLYQSLSVSLGPRALLRLTQWLIYALIGHLVALIVGRIIIGIRWPGASDIWPHLCRAILWCLASSVVISTLAGLLRTRNPLDALKDR